MIKIFKNKYEIFLVIDKILVNKTVLCFSGRPHFYLSPEHDIVDQEKRLVIWTVFFCLFVFCTNIAVVQRERFQGLSSLSLQIH